MEQQEEDMLLADKIDQEQTLQDIIDRQHFSGFHYKLFLVCGLAWMSDASQGAVLSFLMPQLRADWGISTEQEANIATALAVGQATGALTFGALSDYAGRRPTFVMSIILSAVFGSATAVAPTYDWMIALQFFTGFAIGGNLPLAVSLIDELMPTRRRSQSLVLLQLFMEAGALGAGKGVHSL